MKLKDIYPNCKIKNKLGYELIIDKIIDDEIYTTAWNWTLKKFDRLRWLKSQVEEQITKLEWTLLDDKVRITKKELLKLIEQHFGSWYVVSDFEKDVRNPEDIVNKKLVEWDVVYLKWVPFTFVKYEDGKMVTTNKDLKSYGILVNDDTLKLFSFGTWNTVSLLQVAEKIYWVSDTSIFIFEE